MATLYLRHPEHDGNSNTEIMNVIRELGLVRPVSKLSKSQCLIHCIVPCLVHFSLLVLQSCSCFRRHGSTGQHFAAYRSENQSLWMCKNTFTPSCSSFLFLSGTYRLVKMTIVTGGTSCELSLINYNSMSNLITGQNALGCCRVCVSVLQDQSNSNKVIPLLSSWSCIGSDLRLENTN